MNDENRRLTTVVVLLFVFSCVSLFFQFFPSLWWSVVSIVDVRNWSWTVIWSVNAVVIASLFAYRAWTFRNYK